MVSIRSVLLALPTLYLLIALVFLGNGRGGPALPAMNTVPQRVLFITNAMSGGGGKPAAVAPPAAASGAVKNEGPAPPKPTTALESVTFYDGNTVNVYPFATEGTGSESWWKNIARGWEEDSLMAIKAMLTKRCV